MKRRIILFRSYTSMLFFDILQVSANPLLSKPNKYSWKKLRQQSNGFYKLIKKMMK